MAFAFEPVRCGRWFWFARVCAGIRDLLACFMRCPCAGRHLLFFAAAKKSRQKKAAHTASSCSCLRAPNRSLTSHGNHVTHVCCQRSCGAPHPLHAPALQHAVPDFPPPPSGKLCVGRSTPYASLRTDSARVPPRKSATLYDAATYTQFATWAARTIRCRLPLYRCLKRVMRLFKALATSTDQSTAV
jgi:hypothetical protein